MNPGRCLPGPRERRMDLAVDSRKLGALQYLQEAARFTFGARAAGWNGSLCVDASGWPDRNLCFLLFLHFLRISCLVRRAPIADTIAGSQQANQDDRLYRATTEPRVGPFRAHPGCLLSSNV